MVMVMKNFRKNILFLVLASLALGLCFTPDLSAMKEGDRKRKSPDPLHEDGPDKKKRRIGQESKEVVKTQDVIGTKTGKEFLMVFNDPNLLEQMWEAFNAAFKRTDVRHDYNKKTWKEAFSSMIKSLARKDSKDIFHAIKNTNDDNAVVSFMIGHFLKFEGRKDLVVVDFLGTVPVFEGDGLGWQLIESIFDQYPDVMKTVVLEPLDSAAWFYCTHGFTGTNGCCILKLLRNNAKELKNEIAKKLKECQNDKDFNGFIKWLSKVVNIPEDRLGEWLEAWKKQKQTTLQSLRSYVSCGIF